LHAYLFKKEKEATPVGWLSSGTPL